MGSRGDQKMPPPRGPRFDGADHGRIGGGRTSEIAALRVRDRGRGPPRPAQEPGPGPRRRKARPQQPACGSCTRFRQEPRACCWRRPRRSRCARWKRGTCWTCSSRGSEAVLGGAWSPWRQGRPGPAAGDGPGRTAERRPGYVAMGADATAAADRTPRLRRHPPFAGHVRRAGLGDRQRLGAAEDRPTRPASRRCSRAL